MLNFKYKLMKKKQLIVRCQRQLLKKTLRVMKLTLIVLLAFIFKVNAGGFSQVIRVSIDCRNERLGQVFKDLERQTNYYFFFNDKTVDTDRKVSFSIKEEELESALTKIIGNGYRYELVNNLIVVTKNSVVSDAQQIEKRKITGLVKDKQGTPLPGVTILIKGTQTGTATDVDGKFTITTTQPGTVTLVVSFVGMKTKEVAITSDKPVTIVIEENEQMMDEVIVNGYQRIDRKLFTGAASVIKADKAMIDGVSDVSRMLQGKAAGVQVQNVSGTFGASPKIRVRGASSIYGNQKPLWVVDGIVLEDVVEISADDLSSGNSETLISSAVAGLNSDDIESFQILKDASATALYGARAMNGVVVITTKKGKKGSLRVNYSGEFTVRMKPSYGNYNVMNSQEQMMVYKEMEAKGWLNYSDVSRSSNGGVYRKMADLISSYDPENGFGLPNTQTDRARFLQKYEKQNTDWFDVLFQNSLQQVHSLSISSGTEKSRFYASVSLFDDAGWSMADKVSRYTGNMNASFDINKYITVNLLTNASLRRQQAPGTNSRQVNVVEGTFVRDFDINPFSYALNTSRTMRPYDDNGDLEYYTMNYTPFSILHEIRNNTLQIDMMDSKFQGELEIKPIPGLDIKVLGAIRYVKTTREQRIRETSNAAEVYRSAADAQIRAANKYLYNDPDYPSLPASVVMPKGGFYNRDENTLLNYYERAMANYTKTIDDLHILNVLVGQEIKYADRTIAFNKGFGYQWDRGGVPFVDYRIIKQQLENGTNFYGMEEEYDRFSAFFGTLGYSYHEKYIFNATGRYDGSNKLGKSKSARWLPTWNVSGAWHVSNENFLTGNEALSQLTLRGTYGLTASMGPASNALPVFYNQVTFRPTQSEKENQIYISSLENSQLTWEKQYETNIGLDMGFINNRISLSMDAYWRKGFDLIGIIRTSGIGGEISKYANYADMKSNGIEFTLNTRNVVLKDFSWTSNLTFSYNKNEIKSLESRPRVIDLVRDEGYPKAGYPVRGLFSIPFMGLNQEGLPQSMNESGETTVGGLNFQETIKVGYLKYEGPIDPKISGGFDNTFKYRNFTLNVFMNYQFGNKIRLTPAFKSEYSDIYSMPKEFSDRWVLPGDEVYTNIPVIASARQESDNSKLKQAYNAYNYSDVRVADGSFIRLKDITLSYDIPKKIINSIGISDLQLRMVASNVVLLYSDKKLKGQDPEFFRSGGVAMPVPRQFTFTVKLGF